MWFAFLEWWIPRSEIEVVQDEWDVGDFERELDRRRGRRDEGKEGRGKAEEEGDGKAASNENDDEGRKKDGPDGLRDEVARTRAV